VILLLPPLELASMSETVPSLGMQMIPAPKSVPPVGPRFFSTQETTFVLVLVMDCGPPLIFNAFNNVLPLLLPVELIWISMTVVEIPVRKGPPVRKPVPLGTRHERARMEIVIVREAPGLLRPLFVFATVLNLQVLPQGLILTLVTVPLRAMKILLVTKCARMGLESPVIMSVI
jgi:hypothetical protein